MGGGSTFSNVKGAIADNIADANSNLSAHKETYGTGVSTKIMIVNQTGETIKADENSYQAESGRWDTDPPASIPDEWIGTCLHCKRDATACGSIASIEYYGKSSGKRVRISWDTPYDKNLYVNKCSVNVGTCEAKTVEDY